MRGFLFSILGSFLTPIGIVLIGALDASLVFFLPLGIDFVVILMTARKPDLFWLYGLLATAGSVIGSCATFWIGRKAGDVGLARFVPAKRLEAIKARRDQGAPVVAALGNIPPPFPFTAFVLTSGAVEMNPWAFLGSLAAFRLLRFELEGALASRYGTQILRWMRTPTFKTVIGAFIVLAVVGTIVSAIALVRSTRRARSETAGSPPLPRTAKADRRPR
jgi:membrane protein YqaA with SNARE-associated domain